MKGDEWHWGRKQSSDLSVCLEMTNVEKALLQCVLLVAHSREGSSPSLPCFQAREVLTLCSGASECKGLFSGILSLLFSYLLPTNTVLMKVLLQCVSCVIS